MPDRLASSAAAVSVGRPGEEDAPVATADALRQVRVLLPLPLPAALDYRLPAELALPEPGSFVRVPLGGRSLVGVVWDGAGGDLVADRLRPIAEILPARRLAPDLRRFIERVAAYTMAPAGSGAAHGDERAAGSAPAAAAAAMRPRRRRSCRARTGWAAPPRSGGPFDPGAPAGARSAARRAAAADGRGGAARRVQPGRGPRSGRPRPRSRSAGSQPNPPPPRRRTGGGPARRCRPTRRTPPAASSTRSRRAGLA